METNRQNLILRPDPTRVFFRPFHPTSTERLIKIIARVRTMSREVVQAEFKRLIRDFDRRHTRLRAFLLKRFESVKDSLLTDEPLSEERRLLIGAYLTQEYALEAAALFNPSIVPHPDQSNVPDGAVRFILSLRATGDGHMSSITFRTGLVHADGRVQIDTPNRFVTAAEIVPNPAYEKKLFSRKLLELGLHSTWTQEVLASVGATFTWQELNTAVRSHLQRDRSQSSGVRETADAILSLARANYTVRFDPEQSLSERVLSPVTAAERKGIEDARFVAFREDDGSVTYYATYTAFDGHVLFPQILETKDFLEFRSSTLNGPEVQNKGMALFPRKINGRYAMISRQDNENLYLMYSDHPHFWHEKTLLLRPTFPWEFVQIGNCGSPLETEAGWLLLTHGVGHMRKYSIGAVLLDRDDPSRVLGRLKEPLLSPNAREREGYVPNVVYSCGGMLHNGRLILPYAMSDQSTTFASFELDELLNRIVNN